MSGRVSALAAVRGVALVALGAAAVLGAGRATSSVVFSQPGDRSIAGPHGTPTTRPVQTSVLVCPGPERLGVPGAAAAAQTVRVRTSLPSAGTSGAAATGAGSVQALALPGSSAVATATRAGQSAAASVRTPSGVLVAGIGSLAPGVVAGQDSLMRSGASAGLELTACGPARQESWLVAGGPQAGRIGRLVLVNPGANAVSADVSVLTPTGTVASPSGHGVLVPARSRRVLIVNAIAPSAVAPVVHVVATGGTVYAALGDSWLDGTIPRGGELTTATTAPATQQLITGVSTGGPTTLRVAVPGTNDAVVQARVLTSKGPKGVRHAVTRVAAGRTGDIDLSDLPAGTYAVQVQADVPFVAAVQAQHDDGKRSSDLAWTPAAAPLGRLAGATLPSGDPGIASTLVLAATGAAGRAQVSTVDALGRLTRHTVHILADGIATVPLGSAVSVWVDAVHGSVHGGVIARGAAPGSPLVSAVPLAPLILTQQVTPITQVGP